MFRNIIDRNSKTENYRWSRLPEFHADEQELLRGSADFLGLNYYAGGFAEAAVDINGRPSPSYVRDENVTITFDDKWPVGESEWLHSVPAGLRELLKRIQREYNGPKVIITENGWSDKGQLNDDDRNTYLTEHLKAVLSAIWEDGCNVIGYTYWSFLDTFEWMQGYTYI